jgi:hypothetical protein
LQSPKPIDHTTRAIILYGVFTCVLLGSMPNSLPSLIMANYSSGNNASYWLTIRRKMRGKKMRKVKENKFSWSCLCVYFLKIWLVLPTNPF